MRDCPSFARDIPGEARRGLHDRQALSRAPRVRRKLLRALTIAATVAGVPAGCSPADTPEAASESAARADSASPRDAFTAVMLDAPALTIKRDEFHHAAAELEKAGDCAVRGRFRGPTGGAVKVLLLNDEQMTAWLGTSMPRRMPRGLYESPEQAVVDFDVPVSKADVYHLLIFNRDSTRADLAVEASAQIRCAGGV